MKRLGFLAALSHVTACVSGDESVGALVDGPGNPQPRVGAKLLQNAAVSGKA